MSEQFTLDFSPPPKKPVSAVITGADYERQRDGERLTTQMWRIYGLCVDGEWRTVMRIRTILEARHPGVFFPENSVQAQLRNLRKLNIIVERRRVSDGLSEYRVIKPEKAEAA